MLADQCPDGAVGFAEGLEDGEIMLPAGERRRQRSASTSTPANSVTPLAMRTAATSRARTLPTVSSASAMLIAVTAG